MQRAGPERHKGYVSHEDLRVILEPLWAEYRIREAAKREVQEILNLGVFELLPGMLREERMRRALAANADARFRHWQRWAVVAGLFYGMVPIVLIVLEIGRVAGWWR